MVVINNNNNNNIKFNSDNITIRITELKIQFIVIVDDDAEFRLAYE